MDPEKKPYIIFIDDDPNVLSGLKRSLRLLRDKWNMTFTLSGAEALTMAQKDPCHALVTDLCMPEMSGFEVLKRFKTAHPETIRIVLSGQTDRDAFWEAIGVAHLYMGKPCDSRIMESILSRALAAQTRLTNSSWRRIVSQMECVPFFPDSWQALRGETNKENPSLETLAAIIQQDPGMSVKILQIANSAYFGTSHFFSNAHRATLSLSTEGISALAAYYQSLLDAGQMHLPGDLLASIRTRCRLTAVIARQIARTENPENQNQAFLTGLLYALGEIIFLNHEPEKYRRALTMAYQEKRMLWETERELLDCSHTDLSRFLVCLWGLPEETCAAMTPTSRSTAGKSAPFSVWTISHIAEILAQELIIFPDQEPGAVMEDDHREDLASHLPRWREIARVVFNNMN